MFRRGGHWCRLAALVESVGAQIQEALAMQLRTSPAAAHGSSDTEWQARVDLAAAHRIAFMQGFSEGIFNHLTFVVPGRSDRYYQIPFGMHWSEVTASCL